MVVGAIIILGFMACCVVGMVLFFTKTAIIYERMDARWEGRPIQPWADVPPYCPHCKRPSEGICEACAPLANTKPLYFPND